MINLSDDRFKGNSPVQDAGLIIMNHYIPMLFERLKLIDHNKAFLPGKQAVAVHNLQFLATTESL
ncbi:contractile injection system tape measure protein [Pedobacter sp. AJM]|uniref:contractile injection system tape measure protein n=1 Tax=Pedobacter sp. AJM TaxID=2003629 RepID=UPI00352D0ED4